MSYLDAILTIYLLLIAALLASSVVLAFLLHLPLREESWMLLGALVGVILWRLIVEAVKTPEEVDEG